MLTDLAAATPLPAEERLDAILADYLRAAREGAAPDRAALFDRHPDLADGLREFFDDQDRFDRAAAGLRAAVAAPVRLPAVIGDYQVLGEIARGGMGVVLRARHRTLGRVVALKLMLAGPFATAADRARFRREAEAAASLDHPNIVPIYEVGDAASGPGEPCPFFAMKLLDGSLAQSLGRGDWGPNAPDSPRRAARLVATVARAVHHAHQRGVLHRDLKPGNILLASGGREPPEAASGGRQAPEAVNSERLGPSSGGSRPPLARAEPLVADFGLARRTGSDTAMTQTGAILGTPAYMAPEQAAGKAREVTVASDVWALGAILYELLTGRPPFLGEGPLETIRLVLETTPPRFANRATRDLETISLKCLEKEPARRYASAADLADDLERFLAGEPIRARVVGPLVRGWRWARRQPVVAGLSAALLGAVAVGLTATLLLWQSALAARADANQRREEAHTALTDAERARAEARAAAAEADESFRQTHRAVNAFCTTVADELDRSPRWQPLRQRLLSSARDYYAVFLRRRAGDPTLRHELADTYFSSAVVHSRLGNSAAAAADYREAVALFGALLAEAPADRDLQRKLTNTMANLATHQELAEGLKTSGEVLALYDRFLAARPGDLDLSSGRARALTNHGVKLFRQGDLESARSCFERALTEQEGLVERHPWQPALRGELASTFDQLGVLLERRGERVESLCCYLRALDLRQELAIASPDDDVRQADFAAMLRHVAIALAAVGQVEPAREAFDRAVALRRELARRYPQAARYRRDLAVSLGDLAIRHSRDGRRDLALQFHHQAREVNESLLEKSPGSSPLRAALAENWFNIGVIHGALDQRAHEGDALRRARQLQEGLVKQSPENAEYRAALGRTLNNLGINLWVRKQERESKEVLSQAVESTRQLLQRAPGVLTYRRMLNNHYGVLAEIEWRLGNADASVEWVTRRQALWSDNGHELYRAAAELTRAAALLGAPGALSPERRKKYDGYLERSLRALRQAARAGFTDIKRVEADRDLAPLRDHAEYLTILKEMRRRAAR